jgi:hypothetical protein
MGRVLPRRQHRGSPLNQVVSWHQMLSLESPQWTELTHAYGAATNIPQLLRDLETYPPSEDPQAEPYFSLWSALCHQGTVYPASFAAMPHLVAALGHRPERAPWTLFSLVGAIEAARAQIDDVEFPADLAAPYFEALQKLPAIAMRAASEPWDELRCRAILGSVAAAKGHSRLSAAIEELEPEVVERLLDHWVFE